MRPIIAAAMILASVACAQKTAFQEFKEASGEFSADLPSNWHRDGQEDLRRRPAASMTWVAEVAAESEGQQVGAMIHVSRFQRGEVPAGFRKSTLEATDALFGSGPLPPGAPANIATLTVSGHPARRYRRDFAAVLGGGMHKTAGPIAMRLEDVVIQTADAYFVLEYRATKELFEKHYPAFERLAATFRLAK